MLIANYKLHSLDGGSKLLEERQIFIQQNKTNPFVLKYFRPFGEIALSIEMYTKCIPNWDSFRENFPSFNLCWDKNALRLNRNNFQMVIAINILFSALHTTPYFYRKLYFRVLDMHNADDTRPDTPCGSKPPYRVGVFKSLQISCVHRGVQSLLICPVG